MSADDLLHDPNDIEHSHRDVGGGQARAAIFGVSDGLVSNASLILGVAGADSGSDFVRVAGLAGLVAGAISMAAGEWVSVQAQRELLERELALERRELLNNPEHEAEELAALYVSRGIDRTDAQRMAEAITGDIDLALEVHAREELGVDPNSLGSPVGASVWSFVSFALGAFVPLLPWFFASGAAATIVSLVLALLAALVVGATLAVFTQRSKMRTALRQAAIAAAAAGVTWVIGSIAGTAVT